mmetsp:Transcript_101317/g.205616  ORF Transcript_101317/g.205616 Transcript_101317/m.205616 type:complete len:367 (+) Transcript_101317:142-1242(+)
MTIHCKVPGPVSECSRIIDLNNEGVSSLASGDMALAISSFCQALDKSKTRLGQKNHGSKAERQQDPCPHERNECYEERIHQHASSQLQDVRSHSQSVPHFDIGHLMEANCFGLNANEENDDQNLGTENSSCKIKISVAGSLSSAYSNTRNTNTEKINSDTTNHNFSSGDFIYCKPIQVPEFCAHRIALQRSEVILPSIAIFNLALAHHLWAKEKLAAPEQEAAASSSSSLLLQKAAQLYGLAIQLQEGQMVSKEQNSYSKLFFLSCINNLGNTHRLLGDAASAKKIYEQLLTMLMYLNYSEKQQRFELSTTETTSSNPSSSLSSARIASTTTSSVHVSTSSYSAGSTYGSFFRNIFQTKSNPAPAA